MENRGNQELCNTWCRICLKFDCVNLNIFGQICLEKNIAMKLNKCFLLNISESDDKRTQYICRLCYLTLEATYEMRQNAIRSDRILRDLLQQNIWQSQMMAASSSTLMDPPEQKKMKVQSSTNLPDSNIVPGINCADPQIRPATANKENEALQFTVQQPNVKKENLQLVKQRLNKETQKVKQINKLGDLDIHGDFNNKIIRNGKSLAQTPHSRKLQSPDLFPMLVHSPPMSNVLQRKRPREQIAESINIDISGELPIHSVCSTPSNQKSMPATPKRNLIYPHTPLPFKTAVRVKAVHKKPKALLPDNRNISNKNNQIKGKNSRSPLTEKVLSIENYSEINRQTPKTNQINKMPIKNDAKITANAKCWATFSAEKKQESYSSKQHILEKVPAELKMKNIESPKESAGNSIKASARGAIDRCINQNQAKLNTQTPSKLKEVEELANKTKSDQAKMKRLDKNQTSLTAKDARDVFEFTGSPIMEIAPSFTHAKRTAKRPAVTDSSEVCFETPPAKNNEYRELVADKKSQQEKLITGKYHSTSPSIHEELDSSLETLPPFQSEKTVKSVKSMTKLLPDDVCDSWKKACGTWASQNTSNESEDPFNDGDLEACMATGDIFGASIATKIAKRNTNNSAQKMHNANKKGTKSGISSLPSPPSTLSSNGEQQKWSISSLNLSSADESLKTYNTRSKLVKENPMPVPKMGENDKSIEVRLKNTKTPLKLLNSPSKGINFERVAEESDQSNSSDYHLTPQFGKWWKK